MSISEITRPLPGERVVALAPRDAEEAAVTWLRRPNLFPGRTLTARTLEARSRWAAGRVAQRGQAFTAGVVRGLDVGWVRGDAPDEGGRPEVRLRLSAGQGLAASGEDLMLTRPLEADLWALPVVAPSSVFDGGGFGGGGVLQPRAVGPSLGELLDEHPGALPRAGVLVVQPAAVERAEIDPEDPCDRGCPEENVAFEDWRVADAARLLWYAWPEDWRPLPPANPRFRNRLAHTVFEAEGGLSPGELLPWEEFGLPLALLGVDPDHVPVFADHAAVVRRGGRARHSRLRLSAPGGSAPMKADYRLPALWQARVEQLAEQLTAGGDPAPPADVLAEAFALLPPFGLLPRNAVDLSTDRSDFFPATVDLDAVPIPVEQLDLAFRESAGMAAVDLAAGGRLRVLVPVSQASYEPRLLHTEEIDPEFQATLDRFLVARMRALAGRRSVRVKSSVLLTGLRGEAPPLPEIDDDPQALEPETLEGWVPEAVTGGHRVGPAPGLHGAGFSDASETLVPAAGDLLHTWVYLDPDRLPRTLMLEWRAGRAEHRAYWGENLIERGTDGRVTRLRIGDLPVSGRWVRLEVAAAAMEFEETEIDGMGFVLYDGGAAFGPSGRVSDGQDVPWLAGRLPEGSETDEEGGTFDFLTANELLAPLEDRHGVVPGDADEEEPPSEGVSATMAALAGDPALTDVLSTSERDQLPERGVEGFIAFLKSRADRADDLIDYGFLRVQTDIYRVRQLVLGSTDATRLAVSPTLAGIAKAETAVASKEGLSSFFERLRSGSGGQEGGASGAASTTASGSGSGSGGATGAGESSLASLMFNAPITNVAGFSSPASLLPRTFTEATRAPVTGAPTAEIVRAQTETKPLFEQATYTPRDITDAAPLVGSFDLRTLSIAERLEQPKAKEARDYSTSTRHETVLGLVRLADRLVEEDGEVPGLFEGIDVWGLTGDGFVPGADDPVDALRRPLRDFITSSARGELFSSLLSPPLREAADEASHFSDTADMADRTVALLRQMEGRVRLYRRAIDTCEAAARDLRKDLSALERRERSWGEVLGEARHDVAVTRALIAEERARVDGINARRAAVLANEVRFFAYARPRAADDLVPAASRPLDPGLLEAPAPACLRSHDEIPEELRSMLAVVREAPADWFRLQRKLLDGLDRVDLLVKAVRTAQIRTRTAAPTPSSPTGTASGLLAAIGKVQRQQRERVSLIRSPGLQIDLSRLAGLSWKGARAEAARVVSLGDLIDGQHGKGDVARNAAAFFERFGRICGCLHAGFSGVVPSIRLDWAEVLSQFDEAPNLRSLSRLPRWAEIDYADRRRLQGLVDWLFDQLDPEEQRAQALVGDVVRICLLLASHAPVGRIVAGRLPRPATARPGARIPLVALDPSRLRVGMHALVYRADMIVARGIVEDLGEGEASARVTYTAQESVDLDETVRVQFSEPTAVSIGTVGAALRKV